jgi:ribosomal protein S14
MNYILTQEELDELKAKANFEDQLATRMIEERKRVLDEIYELGRRCFRETATYSYDDSEIRKGLRDFSNGLSKICGRNAPVS